MKNVVEFPTKSVQDWNVLKDQISSNLKLNGSSEEFESIVLERMKIAFDEFQFSYPLNIKSSPESRTENFEQLKGFENALKAQTSKLLMSRLKLEIRLALAEGYE